MRRWVGRCFWLIASGVWVWCGFGLYRELPRSLGSPIVSLALEPNEWVDGFVRDSEVVVTRIPNYIAGRYRSWDARNGRRLHEWQGPDVSAALSLKHGVVVGTNLEKMARNSRVGLVESLDLRTGRRIAISKASTGRAVAFHPSKTWFAAIERRDVQPLERLHVFDFRSGCEIGTPLTLGPDDHLRSVRFVGAEGEMIVLVDEEYRPNASPRARSLKHWHPEKGQVRPPSRLPANDYDFRTSDAGIERVLMKPQCTGPGRIVVVDHRSCQSLFDTAEEGVNPWWQSGISSSTEPTLSEDGRVLVNSDGLVWDIDKREVVWSPLPSVECVRRVDAKSGFMFVEEAWDQLLGDWSEWLTIRTLAVRELETGRLRNRVCSKPSLVGECEMLGVTRDGVVYELTAHVNWLVLALSQTILALPQLIVWLILRWRRKRWMRIASAAP